MHGLNDQLTRARRCNLDAARIAAEPAVRRSAVTHGELTLDVARDQIVDVLHVPARRSACRFIC